MITRNSEEELTLPDRHRNWKDRDGAIWFYDGDGWAFNYNHVTRRRQPPRDFPWKEIKL